MCISLCVLVPVLVPVPVLVLVLLLCVVAMSCHRSSGAFVMFECEADTRWAYLNSSIQLGMKVSECTRQQGMTE
jgi:hypothetical protein